jgi:hypothetical protein
MRQKLDSFQRYQLEFCAYLRDPSSQAMPTGTTARGMAVYEEIVFNNITQSISACFPVAQQVIGAQAWLALTRGFLSDYSASSPIFRDIPAEFLQFLAAQDQLPPYLLSLCHYEWVELDVASMVESVYASPPRSSDGSNDILTAPIVFTAAMQLLHYDYAVHKISTSNENITVEATQLLVYRDAAYAVKFVELNAATYRLVALLQAAPICAKEALHQLAQELGQVPSENLMQFGRELLEDFSNKGIIIASSQATS